MATLFLYPKHMQTFKTACIALSIHCGQSIAFYFDLTPLSAAISWQYGLLRLIVGTMVVLIPAQIVAYLLPRNGFRYFLEYSIMGLFWTWTVPLTLNYFNL